MRLQRIFATFLNQLQRPTLDVIPIVSSWTLPPGVIYDATYDALVDGSGNVVNADPSYYTTTQVEYVPLGYDTELLQLMSTGVVSGNSMKIMIRHADVAALQEAWRVEIGGQQYQVRSIRTIPPSDPELAEVTLDEP